MTRHILIVDTNEAFATMLRQGLEEMEDTEVALAFNGRDATRAVASKEYDLAIVDMGLTDIESHRLVRALRREHPYLRLVVIPLDGAEVPPELADMDLQGTLPKPFFLPELPSQVEGFLAQTVGGAPERREEPPPTPAPPTARPSPTVQPRSLDFRPQAVREMSRLAQEVGADGVLLTRGGELVAHAGRLPKDKVVSLASLVGESWQTAVRVAEALSKDQRRFEQSTQGSNYLLYSMVLSEGLILAVVVTGRASLGMIRHRAKETAEILRGLVAG